MRPPIPLSVPNICGNEWKYIKECLDTGWVSSAGKFVGKFEEDFRTYVGSNYAIACSSGTAALHVALKLAGVKPGDLVLAPSLTFIASINAISYLGADPYFFDSDEHYNLDQSTIMQFFATSVEKKHNEFFHKASGRRIGAVMLVHVFGNAGELFELSDFCNANGIPLIEDAAESLGTRYNSNAPEKFKGRHTGTVGSLGCFSFNGNKILTTGGGGMIVTNDPNLAKKAKYLTTQSKDDELFFIHHEVGYNYRMTNIQAAMGVAQLEQIDSFLKAKRRIHDKYLEEFKQIPGIKLAPGPTFAENNHWLNCVQIDANLYSKNRDEMLSIFRNHRIEGRPVWHLNHLQRPFLQAPHAQIRNAINLLESTINIPSSTNLTAEEQSYVIDVLKNPELRMENAKN